MKIPKILALVYSSQIGLIRWHLLTSAFAGQIHEYEHVTTWDDPKIRMVAFKVTYGFVVVPAVLEQLVESLGLHAAIMMDPVNGHVDTSMVVDTNLHEHIELLRRCPETSLL